MKRQTGAGWQARHRVNIREPEGYRRGMRRCALVWLLASALAAVGTPDASARHTHVSQHRKKAVEVEQHKHRIDSAVESTTPLPPDVAAAKQAIELVRRHKSNEATTLAASSGDPVVKKLVEWALLRRFEAL